MSHGFSHALGLSSSSSTAYTASSTTSLTNTPNNPVLTFLTPSEQARVDAAGHGCYSTKHHEDLEQVISELRQRPASAIIVSASRYRRQHATQMARLVREFPRVPAVALLTATDADTTHALLSMGHNGVDKLVDARDPAGWRDLRQYVANNSCGSIEQRALQCLQADLADASAPCMTFFETLFAAPTSLTTVRQLANQMGVMPTTFMSRFFRNGLPAPKKYLALARLVRAAALLENPGYSITQAALMLEYSSPQSFSRHVRSMLNLSGAEFRMHYNGDKMLHEFRARLVLPFISTLTHFNPVEAPPQWLSTIPNN